MLHPAKGDILLPGKHWLPTDVVPQQAEDSLTVGPRPREGVIKVLMTIGLAFTTGDFLPVSCLLLPFLCGEKEGTFLDWHSPRYRQRALGSHQSLSSFLDLHRRECLPHRGCRIWEFIKPCNPMGPAPASLSIFSRSKAKWFLNVRPCKTTNENTE